ARNNVDMALGICKNGFDGYRGRIGDPEQAWGRFFIKFLAPTISVRMQTIVSKSKIKDLMVNNAILVTETYRIIDDGDLRIRMERIRRVREIPELFGVGDPEQLLLSGPVCCSTIPGISVSEVDQHLYSISIVDK
ncbi:MAG: hypothetical protein PHF83_07125, partial [Candidatus Methanomethylophilus sp.]|nr:hypothetical protein [Methanomethylophilus sp.]